MAKTKSVSIEENFVKLEELISSLEQNDLSLEEAFRMYETGIKLTAQCSKQLDKVEKQIIILKEESSAADVDDQQPGTI